MSSTSIPDSTIAQAGQIPEKLPFWKKVMYALGQFGWSLAAYAAGNLLIAYYQASEAQGQLMYPTMIPQGYVLGILTIIGLVFFVGLFFDGIVNPVVAVMSDRSRSRFGKRRVFLAWSFIPVAVLSLLIFWPPFGAGAGANLVANAIWVTLIVLVFYWFLTMYVTPYTALLTELGHDSAERLQLSTMISITWALGFMVGSQAYSLQGIFTTQGMPTEMAFRMVMIAFAILSVITMALPIIFIDERRYCLFQPSDDGLFRSLRKIWQEKNFLRWVSSDFMYWVALAFITTGMTYFITVLLGQKPEFVSTVMIVLFLASFVLYVPVGILARKLGKKPMLLTAFIMFAITFGVIGLMGILPIDAQLQGYVVAILAAPALAIFSVLPNAMVSDMAEMNTNLSGEQKGGMFFGFRTFMMKVSTGLGGMVLPSLILIGAKPHSNAGDLGVRMVAILAVVFCLLGFFLLRRYDEKIVLAHLKDRSTESGLNS